MKHKQIVGNSEVLLAWHKEQSLANSMFPEDAPGQAAPPDTKQLFCVGCFMSTVCSWPTIAPDPQCSVACNPAMGLGYKPQMYEVVDLRACRVEISSVLCPLDCEAVLMPETIFSLY